MRLYSKSVLTFSAFYALGFLIPTADAQQASLSDTEVRFYRVLLDQVGGPGKSAAFLDRELQNMVSQFRMTAAETATLQKVASSYGAQVTPLQSAIDALADGTKTLTTQDQSALVAYEQQRLEIVTQQAQILIANLRPATISMFDHIMKGAQQ